MSVQRNRLWKGGYSSSRLVVCRSDSSVNVLQAFFQCIHAQFDSTLLFGSAFIHTISRYAESGVDLHMTTPPPGMDHDELRRREAHYVAGLTSNFGSVSSSV
jgi:hypothetical protein